MFLVIVDKPFANSSSEADKVIAIANQKGLIVTCFQNRSYVRFTLIPLPPLPSVANEAVVLGWRLQDSQETGQEAGVWRDH